MEQLELLEKIGLDKKQAKVYLASLEFGPTSIANLAIKSGIKRTTIHEFIDELVDQGYIIKTFKGKRKLYNAAPPETLETIWQRQNEIIKKLLPDLNFLASKSPQKPKIRYYEGVEGIKQVYEDYLTTKGEIYYFGATKDEAKLLGKKYIDDWVKKRKAKGIKVNAIRMKSRELPVKEWQGGKEHLRELKYFPGEAKEGLVNIVIYDNKVSIVLQ